MRMKGITCRITLCFSILLLALMILPAHVASARPESGPGLLTAYAVTTGTGQSDEGIPTDPYKTLAHDLAHKDAGIENFNNVYYTSVLPPEPYEVPTESGEIKHKPITLRLINLIEKEPEIGRLLEKSIAEAKRVNPDKKTNPVQSLSEYYDYLDQLVEKLPDTQIGSDIHYFCFLVDQPLPELEGKGLYKNSLQFYPPFSSWMRDFAIARGTFLDTEKSWSEEIYQQFYNDPRFGLQKGWYESPSNWKTWNQFFSRYLKTPGARPIASPNDPSIVVSPADSVPQGIWAIDKDSKISVENGLKVKLATYYHIEDLLGKDSQYKDAFANGLLTHAYLSPTDYHRYHFAVGGTVKEKKIIQQNVACEAKWNTETRTYDAIDSIGWQFTQTRGYVIVDTGNYGLVALIPIGMDLVSSVNFEDNVTVGSIHRKGDMLGTFKFGGSDFIMLFQEKAGFKMTAPAEDKTNYKHILVGEEYGVMNGPSNRLLQNYWWIVLGSVVVFLIVLGIVYKLRRK